MGWVVNKIINTADDGGSTIAKVVNATVESVGVGSTAMVFETSRILAAVTVTLRRGGGLCNGGVDFCLLLVHSLCGRLPVDIWSIIYNHAFHPYLHSSSSLQALGFEQTWLFSDIRGHIFL